METQVLDTRGATLEFQTIAYCGITNFCEKGGLEDSGSFNMVNKFVSRKKSGNKLKDSSNKIDKNSDE